MMQTRKRTLLKTKRWTWRKPNPSGKPPRPLHAYNLFFEDTKKEIEESKIKLDMSLVIYTSMQWKYHTSDSIKAEYEAKAAAHKKKYQLELEEWAKHQPSVNTNK